MTVSRLCIRLNYRLANCHLLTHYESFSETNKNILLKLNSIAGNMQKTFKEG